MSAALDLEAYLQRIRYAGSLRPASSTLEALHLAHATHIPFENLDVLLRRPIRLDLQSLQDKLVRQRRGGYCYEHNLLFAAVLERVGFRVRGLAARVRIGGASGVPRPRTHMLLRVEVDGDAWLADVGFGAAGLLLPVPFTDGAPAHQYLWSYRLIKDALEPGQWVLQADGPDGWHDLYAFTLQPQLQADYEMANHYTATHPDSRFVHTLTAQLPSASVRTILRNRELILDHGRTVARHQLRSSEEVARVLAEVFGVTLPGEAHVLSF